MHHARTEHVSKEVMLVYTGRTNATATGSHCPKAQESVIFSGSVRYHHYSTQLERVLGFPAKPNAAGVWPSKHGQNMNRKTAPVTQKKSKCN
jgi:hypothetical protein